MHNGYAPDDEQIPIYRNLLVNFCGIPEGYLNAWHPRARQWGVREFASSDAEHRQRPHRERWRLGLLVSWLKLLAENDQGYRQHLTALDAFCWCLLLAADPKAPHALAAGDLLDAWPADVDRPWRYAAAGLTPDDLTALDEPPSADALRTLAGLRGVHLPALDVFAA